MDVAEAKERRGRGRPRKGTPQIPRAITMSHTFTPEGVDLINRLAERFGMSQSAVLELAAQRLAGTLESKAA